GNLATADLDRAALRAGDLGAREQRATKPVGRVEHRAARGENLRERLSPCRTRRSVRAHQRPDVVRAGVKALIDCPVESAAEAEVEEQARRREDDGHRDRERKREAKPDRYRREAAHEAHPPPSGRRRYPTPRTASIQASPHGRTMLCR